MKPIVLFRNGFGDDHELEVVKKTLPFTQQRGAVPADSLVIGRYSVLPYYRELEEDLKLVNSHLINSYRQHRWIADFDYYETVKEYTFETWFDSQYLPKDDTQYVVKGRTNSRKGYWNTKMFAKDRRTAIALSSELLEDDKERSRSIERHAEG